MIFIEISILQKNNKKYIKIKSYLDISYDFLMINYKMFFMPIEEKFPIENYEKNSILPYKLILEDNDYESFVQIDNNTFYDLPLVCEGYDLLLIEHDSNYINKLILDLNSLLNEYEKENDYYILYKQLLEFIKNNL